MKEMTGKVEIKDLNIFYGDFHAVKNVNLTLFPRTVTAFIGPSGCGKSTLLRSINRMQDLYPNQRSVGRIEFDGVNVLEEKDVIGLRKQIGMVFQRPTPFPMSIFDNVAYGIRLHEKVSSSELSDRVEWALRKAALWDDVKDKLGQKGGSLSGGQQQRLCIARAIAVMPQVLLLDEPCSALDPISTARIEELIHELKKEYTVAVVTHSMSQAKRISDFTAFMYLGELVEFGATRDVFENPKHARTSDYVNGRFG